MEIFYNFVANINQKFEQYFIYRFLVQQHPKMVVIFPQSACCEWIDEQNVAAIGMLAATRLTNQMNMSRLLL